MAKDDLGDRMKAYEDAFRYYIPARLPVILRIDGKAFHSYTTGCKKPFDDLLIDVISETAQHLCQNIQTVAMAYAQSDEISLLLIPYKKLGTQAWFDNNLQKMCSVAAGMASSYMTLASRKIFGEHKLAVFDCRAFLLPKEEVNNYFLWRQQDAIRNSAQMLARSLYSHKECDNKNTKELKEMCSKKNYDWDNLPTLQKRGRCLVKEYFELNNTIRSRWITDKEIPIFSQNTDYINQYVFFQPGTEEES